MASRKKGATLISDDENNGKTVEFTGPDTATEQVLTVVDDASAISPEDWERYSAALGEPQDDPSTPQEDVQFIRATDLGKKGGEYTATLEATLSPSGVVTVTSLEVTPEPAPPAPRRPLWQTIPDAVTPASAWRSASEALVAAGQDWTVDTLPMFVDLDGERSPTGYVAIVRRNSQGDSYILGSGTDKEMSKRGRGYHAIDNMAVARALDVVTEQYPVETVIPWKHGAGVAMQLRAHEAEVRGEPIVNYFTIVIQHTGSIWMFSSPRRLFCENVVVNAFNSSLLRTVVPHTATGIASLDFKVGLLPVMDHVQRDAVSRFEAMTRFKPSPEQVSHILQQAYPDVKVSDELAARKQFQLDHGVELPEGVSNSVNRVERYQGLINKHRAGALNRFTELADVHPQFAGTGWLLLQAVTEREDHLRSGKSRSWEGMFGYRAEYKRNAAAAIYAEMTA